MRTMPTVVAVLYTKLSVQPSQYTTVISCWVDLVAVVGDCWTIGVFLDLTASFVGLSFCFVFQLRIRTADNMLSTAERELEEAESNKRHVEVNVSWINYGQT